MNYVDYTYYADIYKGTRPKPDFDKLVIRASAEVRKNIFNRDITGYENEVKLATCSVCDILLKIEKLESKKNTLISEKELKSESVGDYSKTYSSVSLTDIDKQITNLKSKIKEELGTYLLDTGLLYRGGWYV